MSKALNRGSRQAAVGSLAAFCALVAAIVAVSVVQSAVLAWFSAMGFFLVFCAAVGVGLNGRPAGLVIDNRNRVSLSKLQAAAWTVIVLSALLTATITRIRIDVADPIAVNIPIELLAAMGIAATSLVATPIILSLKSDQPAPDDQAAATATKLGEDPEGITPVGKVFARDDPASARWLDIFRGEEVSNAASPDLSKLQQALITVVVLIAYCALLYHTFGGKEFLKPGRGDPSFMVTLPLLSPHMVWLIGISHAGYLAYKAAPHGRTDANGAQPQSNSVTVATDNAVG